MVIVVSTLVVPLDPRAEQASQEYSPDSATARERWSTRPEMTRAKGTVNQGRRREEAPYLIRVDAVSNMERLYVWYLEQSNGVLNEVRVPSVMRKDQPRRRVAAAAVGVLLAACAANQPNLGSRDARDILSSDEIVVHSFVTAYDAVRALRPWWLGRLNGTIGGPAVYRDDDQLSGGFLALRNVLIETVGELRFYETYHAVAKWGEAVARRSGVIQIVSRN